MISHGRWRWCQSLLPVPLQAPDGAHLAPAHIRCLRGPSWGCAGRDGTASLQQGCGVSGPGVWTEWGLWGRGELCGGLPLSWVGALGGGSEHWGPGVQEVHFRPMDMYRRKVRGWKKIFHANGNQKKARLAILISEKINLKINTIIRDKEGHGQMIKGSVQEKDITILTIYVPYIRAP